MPPRWKGLYLVYPLKADGQPLTHNKHSIRTFLNKKFDIDNTDLFNKVHCQDVTFTQERFKNQE